MLLQNLPASIQFCSECYVYALIPITFFLCSDVDVFLPVFKMMRQLVDQQNGGIVSICSLQRYLPLTYHAAARMTSMSIRLCSGILLMYKPKSAGLYCMLDCFRP